MATSDKKQKTDEIEKKLFEIFKKVTLNQQEIAQQIGFSTTGLNNKELAGEFIVKPLPKKGGKKIYSIFDLAAFLAGEEETVIVTKKRGRPSNASRVAARQVQGV